MANVNVNTENNGRVSNPWERQEHYGEENVENNNENIDPFPGETLNDETLISKDYECSCFGRTVINASPRIIFTFIISLVALISSSILIYLIGQVTVFASIITAIVAFWLPSPIQSSLSKKDAVDYDRLLQHNLKMTQMMTRYGIVNRQQYGSNRYGQNYGSV